MNTQKFLINIIKAGEPSTTRLAYYRPDGTNYCYISNAEGTAAMMIFDEEMILDVDKFDVLKSNQLEALMKGLEGYADAVITDEIREFKHNGKKTKGRIIKNTETDTNIMVNDKLLDYFKGYKLLAKGKTDSIKVVVDNQVVGIILPIRYKED